MTDKTKTVIKNLTKVDIRNQRDVDNCVKEIMHQRKKIATMLNIKRIPKSLKNKYSTVLDKVLENNDIVDKSSWKTILYRLEDKCRKESRRCYKRDGSCRCEGGRRL